MPSMLSLQTAIVSVGALIVYVIIQTIYRLYFHPLAKFPGPKLAAVTFLYNAYYDILGSGMIHELPEMHRKYGPIIRIRPNDLHFSRLEDYNQIFRVGTPFDRIWHQMHFLTGSLQSKETLPETKKRKEFLSPFFSKAVISRVEPFLHRKKLAIFLSTLQKAATDNGGKGTVVDFYLGFRCLSGDLIMDYCFQSDLNALAQPGFQSKTMNAMVEGFDLAIAGMYFPKFFGALNNFILRLPEHIREKHFAPVYGFQTIQRASRERVEWLIANPEKRDDKVPTMFDSMLAPDTSKGQVTPPFNDMVAEGTLMIAAGTDTTANTLGIVLWHVSQDKEIEGRLVAELKAAIPDRDTIVSSGALESGKEFIYLRAVVKEALRLAYGVPGRICRKTPKEGAKFGEYFVPGGTVVSAGILLQNTNEDVFPDPMRFDPERWLCDDETYRLRDKSMVSFSRGSRSCVGINLANATLHLTTAHMFRRFDFTTTGYTTERDMEWNDRFVPVPNGRLKGLVRVRDD